MFPKIGGFYPPKWMVKIIENPIKIDDLGVPLFLETSIYALTIHLLAISTSTIIIRRQV